MTSFVRHPSNGPELFFALAAPVGTELDSVGVALRAALEDRGYSVREIQISSLLDILRWPETVDPPEVDDETHDRHIETRMEAGDRLREALGRADAMALLTILDISTSREEPMKASARTAYILKSLKHPHEVQTLRDVYGPNFFLLSCSGPRDVREEHLARRIAADWEAKGKPHGLARDATPHGRAADLIERDQLEVDRPSGQRLRDTFPLADVFVNARQGIQLREEVKRFIELLFDHPFHTPTRDENAMFHAQAASLRSAAPGRQVGAVITNTQGDLIAVGANEVPKAGGGQYWGEDREAERDHQRRDRDVSRTEKGIVLDQILRRLKSAGWLSSEWSDVVSEEFYELTSGLRVHHLIEFGRAVHAEMAAITDSARRGVSVADCTLYSTTFPCHECTRHIIAAGLKRVVYVEPYPKSLAEKLHDDAILVDRDAAEGGGAKVRFEPFVGVAPRRYFELFTPRPGVRRDSEGRVVEAEAGWMPKCVPSATPDVEEIIEVVQAAEVDSGVESVASTYVEVSEGGAVGQQESLSFEEEIEIAETEMMTDERAGLVAAEARDFTSDELYIVREGNEIESLISALEARGFAFKEAQG